MIDIKPTSKGKTFTGVVISDKMTNTIVVSLSYKTQHPLYKKTIKKNKSIYADNNLKASIGDQVLLRETKPISRLKCFTTVEIIKKLNQSN